MTLGDAIKKRRDELGLTQEELGRRIGVTDMTISRWEAGISFPRRSHWKQLEKALKKPLDEMSMVAMCRESA